MSTPEEADRLEKAARAKALLKKHQRKKAAPGRAPTPLSSVVFQSPPDTPFSPAPSEAGDLSEFGELKQSPAQHIPQSSSELPRPAQATTPTAQISPPPLSNGQPHAQLENHQQTISLLVAEKTSLAASLQRLEDDRERVLKDHYSQLEATETDSQKLREDIASLNAKLRDVQEAKSLASAREDEYVAKNLEAEREISLLRTSLSQNTQFAKDLESRVKELQEEVKANGQVEALEKSLRASQERAESLEFQLSKSKQAHVKLKGELLDLESRLGITAKSASESQSKHASLSEELITARASLSSMTEENNALRTDLERALADVEVARKEYVEASTLQSAASAKLVTIQQQLQVAQAGVAAAERRAQGAEQAHQELQNENVQLMASLNEIRPKVVDLTQDKVTLSEEKGRMQRTISTRDATIAQLEATVGELRSSLDEFRTVSQSSEKRWLSEKQVLEANIGGLEKALVEMEEELHNARQSIQEFAAGRTVHHKAVTQYEDTIVRLTEEVGRYQNDVATVEQSLNESNRASEELQDILSRNRSEIELLRTEGLQKDEEILRLKDQISIQNAQPSPSLPPTSSIENELLDIQRQQHALELSTARSQIRSLENALYLEQTKTHQLQRQLGVLGDELNAMTARLTSTPQIPPRPLSAASASSSNAFMRPTIPRPLKGLDSALTPEARHKRKISLSMLKARIDSEREAHAARPVTQALPPLTAMKEEELSSPSTQSPRAPFNLPDSDPTHPRSLSRSQHFRDESHIFWCHACSGDLVVL